MKNGAGSRRISAPVDISVYVALLWITRSLVFQNFFFLYEPAARGFLARFALLNGLFRHPSNCSVEFAATGQIHVVSCCPHQVSVPQCRRDSNLYASAPHRAFEAAREVKLASKGIVARLLPTPAGKGALWCEPASTGAQARSVQTVVPGSNEARWVPAPDAVLTRQAWAASADA